MKRPGFSRWAKSAFAATLLVVMMLGIVTYRNTTVLLATDRLVAEAYRAQEIVESIVSSVRDAANSERGYLLTGDKRYLTDYQRSVASISSKLTGLQRHFTEDEILRRQVHDLAELINVRLKLLDEGISLRQELSGDEGVQTIHEFLMSDRVSRAADDIRRLFERIQEHQHEMLAAREHEATRHATVAHQSIVVGHGIAVAMLILAAAAVLADRRRREQAESQLSISEGRLSAVLDQVGDAVHIADLEGHVVFWNRGAQQLYGWRPEEVTGRLLSELNVPVDEEVASDANRIASETGSWTGELTHRSKDGKEVLLEERRTLIRDEAGAPSAQLVFDMDITERRLFEERQRQSQRLESIGTMAGGIAHDLNNVLTPILMGTKLLAREGSVERRLEMAHTMQTAAERGAEMIKQLLSFAGGKEGRHEALQPVGVVREVQTILQHTLPKSIEIHVDILNDLWQVMGDSTELCQVMLNLCINARDAMPDGGHLTIAAENVDVDQARTRTNPDLTVGPYVMLSVVDTGTGMPDEVLDKIFDPFFTTKEQGKGTGVGLATCLGIIRGHGGAIHVYSQPDCGTEFNIYLPAIRTEPAFPRATAKPGVPKGRDQLIMLVDDEKIVLDIARATLETNGYRVLTASSGAEAVAVYPQFATDVQAVIVDWMMPGMDGAATIKALKAIRSDVRIIISSGFRARLRNSSVVDEARAFLPKPYSDEQLLSTIDQVLSDVERSDAITVNGASY